MIVIRGIMRLRLPRKPLTYVILILYVLIPMLDSMVCADCSGNAPFQGGTTIGHLQSSHEGGICASHDGAQSKPPGEQAAKSFCSICANFLMSVEVFSSHVHIFVAQWDGPRAVPALSELHHSINKPPQNLLV